MKYNFQGLSAKVIGIENLYNILMDAPVVISITKGKDHVLGLANEEAFKLWGKGDEIIGKPLIEGLPELKGQGIIELFDHVFDTGEVYSAKAIPVTSFADGKEEKHYYDIVYQPYYEEGNNRPAGVFSISHEVTQSVVAQDKVAESEGRLNSALGAAKMGTWDHNIATNTVVASEELKKLFGLSPYEVFTYDVFINSVIEEQRANVHQVNQDVMQLKNDQSDYDLQYWIKRVNDGELRCLRAKGKVHVNENGEPERFTGIVLDITKEKRAEERYQYIFETVPLSIWEKDYSALVVELEKLKQRYGEGLKEHLVANKEEVYRLMPLMKINDTNEVSLRMFEAERKEQLLEGLSVVFTEEALPALIGELMAVANKDKSFQDEFVLKTLKGKKITCLTTINFPPNGNYSEVLVSRYDISELKKIEEAFKESEDRFRTMANSIPQLAWMTDEKGWIYWYNDRWYDYTGTTPDEMLGWGWQKVHHPDMVEGVVKRFTAAIEAGISWEDVFPLRSKNGEYRWFLSRSIPVRKDDGTLIGWFGTNTDVTEQRQIENALKKNEQQLLLALEGGELGYFDFYPETGELMWSARMRELFGLPSHTAIDYKGFLNAVYHEDRERVDASVQRALMVESGGRYENEYRVIELTNGRLRWLRAKGKAFFDEHGRAYRLAGVTQDITKQKEAEIALQQSESNLSNIVLQAPVAMCIGSGPSFIVEVANDSMLELWGTSPEEIIGRPIFEVLTEAGEQGLKQVIEHVYATGERFTANEMPVSLPRNGKIETVYLNFVYEPIKSKGAITKIVAVATDVTDQVVARKKIEESHKEFQFVMDFIPQIIWLTWPDGYHYYYNKQWYDYTGLAYGETTGEGWNDVFHPEDQARGLEIWQHSLDTGEPYEIEFRLRRYDGEYRWFLGRALPLKDENGTIVKWFGTSTDIHDQKVFSDVLEKLVEDRTKELKESNEDLQQFIHMASHDLKEPVRKISMFANRIQKELDDKLDENSKGYLNRVQTGADRIFSIINGVLNYATASTSAGIYESVDLNELIKNVESDLDLPIQQKAATVCYANLPTVEGAKDTLRQVFYNLISNSLKFSRSGIPPAILISSEVIDKEGKSFARIILQDNGVGFEQKYAEKVFSSFTRLHGKDTYEGAGLGLSICKKIIERHGGSIAVKSAENQGAAFEILLPMQQ